MHTDKHGLDFFYMYNPLYLWPISLGLETLPVAPDRECSARRLKIYEKDLAVS